MAKRLAEGHRVDVYDEADDFASRCNLDMVELGAVEEQSDMATLRLLIEAHSQHTSSAKARMVLDAWDSVIQKFVRVMPMAYKAILEQERKQSASSSAVANG